MTHYIEPNEYKSLFPRFIDIVNKQTNITTVFDLGCNVGAFVRFVNNKIPTIKEIIGFEPDKENYEFIIKSNLPNLTIHNKGIYYGCNECEVLGVGDNNHGGYMVSKIEAPHVEVWEKQRKLHIYQNKIFKLDVLENYTKDKPLDLVKIDVEASEYNIFQNSSDIKKFTWIIAEFHNHHHGYYQNFIKTVLPTYTIVDSFEQHFLLKLNYEPSNSNNNN